MGSFHEIRELISEVIRRSYPPRLIYAMASHIKLLDIVRIGSEKGLADDRCMVLHALGVLHGEANELGMDAFLTLRGRFLEESRLGYNAYLGFLTSCYRGSYMLFNLSLNIEPFKCHSIFNRHRISLNDIIVDTARAATRFINRIKDGGVDPYQEEYIRLHTARTLAELGRIAYSLPQSRSVLAGELNCGSTGEPGDLVRCIVSMARELVEGWPGGLGASKLAYIQIVSTETRTPFFRRREDVERLQRNIREAKMHLDRLSLADLGRYDALSLHGSYHYNNGWLRLHVALGNYTASTYYEAAEEFLEAARKFIRIERGGRVVYLSYIRGAYVSLWNHYLMKIAGIIMESHELDVSALEDVVSDVVEWGRLVTDAYTRNSNSTYTMPEEPLFIASKIGIHAWYSHLLSLVLKRIVYNKRPDSAEMSIVNNLYPHRLKIVYNAIDKILSNDVKSAYSIIKSLGGTSGGCESEESHTIKLLDSYISGGSHRHEPPTLREYALYKRYYELLSSGDKEEARKVLALLLAYLL